MDQKQPIHGTVSSITFQNEDTGYKVFQIYPTDQSSSVTCVGVLPYLSSGETISGLGHWEQHKRFGKQFFVENYTVERPTTEAGILALLSAGFVTNIGPVRAKSIVERFGMDTLEVLDNHPEKLCEISGIGKKSVAKISETWNKNRQIRSLSLFLQEYGVSLATVGRIYKTYGSQSEQIITKNPYALCEDVWGIGFLRSDQIAQQMGFAHDSYKRIRAGLIHVLKDAALSGHSCLSSSEMVTKTVQILGVTEERVQFSLDHAISIQMLVSEDKWVYLPYLFSAEQKVAENILERAKQYAQKPHSVPVLEGLNQWLKGYEQKNNWYGDEVQMRAIHGAITSPLMLLTGGPGTGKTTILQVIVSYFGEKGKKICLAAPTGRAAQRMGSIAGIGAKTIHRLLEYRPGATAETSFARNAFNPLEADIIIVDEVSMIDIVLMASLCAAVRMDATLLLVGDHNQLPSVGPGNVLADLISSEMVHHMHLTTIFRQAVTSRIVTAAHEMVSGKTPVIKNSRSENCFFIEQPDPLQCLETIIDLVVKRLPVSYQVHPVDDIQVLSPMHKGVVGTESINDRLQTVFRDTTVKAQFGQKCFFLGDKVMQVKNNYDKNIFNGDIGKIAKMGDGFIEVAFLDNKIRYDQGELGELTLAYCISIHKSQGSEFSVVIIPVMNQHFIMLQRNLIYTALTRAKQLCVFVGQQQAFRRAVQNNRAMQRNSRLTNQIRRTEISNTQGNP